MIVSLWIIFRMQKLSNKSCTENQNTHCMFNNFSPQKSCHFQHTCNVEKYGTPRQTKDDNIIWCMRFACFITKATEALRIYNTSCFSTATMVMPRRINFTFIRTMPVSLTLVSELPALRPGHSIHGGKTMNAGENNLHEYTGRFKQNVSHFRRKFLKWNYINNTKNTYIQQWTAMKLRTRAKSGLLAVTRTILD